MWLLLWMIDRRWQSMDYAGLPDAMLWMIMDDTVFEIE
jgi:hypothetical protein